MYVEGGAAPVRVGLGDRTCQATRRATFSASQSSWNRSAGAQFVIPGFMSGIPSLSLLRRLLIIDPGDKRRDDRDYIQ